MLKPERHIWEEGSTHRAVAGKEYDEVWDYVTSLEAELQETVTVWDAELDVKQRLVAAEAQVARLREALEEIKASTISGSGQIAQMHHFTHKTASEALDA